MLDPLTIQWLCFAGIALCAFMIGLNWARHKTEMIINETIMYLIHNNYIRAKQVDGEWEILDLDQK